MCCHGMQEVEVCYTGGSDIPATYLIWTSQGSVAFSTYSFLQIYSWWLLLQQFLL